MYRSEVVQSVKEFHSIRGCDQKIPASVARLAYEVWPYVWTDCPELMLPEEHPRKARLGVYEMIAALYARSFPQDEWHTRFDEALQRHDYNAKPRSK